MMIERQAANRVRELLATFPVVAVVGPRQVGKSTLVQRPETGADRHYASLDDLAMLGLAQQDPLALLGAAPRVTVDEVQRVPDLLLSVKREVDRNRTPGRFLLTGSANLDFAAGLSRVLAGRVGVLPLRPLTWREQAGTLTPPRLGTWIGVDAIEEVEADLAAAPASPGPFSPEHVLVGGYPPAVTAGSPSQRTLWFESFRYTYLERDVRQLSQVTHLPEFARLLELAAARTGQVLNQASLARDLGMSPATLGRDLALMEATFQIERLTPYFLNIGKRLVKSPKLYWADTGLAAHLLGLRSWDDARRANCAGPLFETFVMMEVESLLAAYLPQARLHYFRSHGGLEVDGLIVAGRRLLPFEIKAATTVKTDDAASLAAFLAVEPRARIGLVVYLGDEVKRLSGRVLALPVAALLR